MWWWWCALAHAGGMPLESTAWTIDVNGPLAEARIDQVFVNDGDEAIEAIYVFPLHEQAAVDSMEITVGDRIVRGAIRERKAARAAYEEALTQGKVAALTEQERANVFTQSVANIPPGERVQVSLTVVQPVDRADGAWTLTLPLVVAPRFVPPGEVEPWLEKVQHGGGAHKQSAGRGSPVSIDAVIDTGLPFQSIDSPSHDLSITFDDGAAWVRADGLHADRDLVLTWTLGQDRPQAAVLVQDGHAVLSIEPPAAPPSEQYLPRELVFVVDTSGSMSGQKITQAKTAMEEAIDWLDDRDTVRVLAFANRVQGTGDRAMHVGDGGRNEARRFVRSLQAGGGTWMINGILAALDAPPDPERQRIVVFLTDGQIGNDRQALATIADKLGGARVFAVGIGPATNRWLLDEMQRVGKGKGGWIGPHDAPRKVMRTLLDALDRPMLGDIHVDWGDWAGREAHPAELDKLYAGEPLFLTARVGRGAGPVRITGMQGDRPWSALIDPIEVEPGRSVPSTWARQHIEDLERLSLWGEIPEADAEILSLSLEYEVLSRLTAFVAIDQQVSVPQGALPTPVDQPLPVPHASPGDVAQGPGSPAGSGIPGAPVPPAQIARVVQTSGATEEILISAHGPTVEETTRGEVLTQEFLTRIPTGRGYQSAVQMAAGVVGGSNPNIGGASYNENTYMLDGVNITDPVTGTFSVNFNYDRLQRARVSDHVPDASSMGALGAAVELSSATPNNNLEVEVRAGAGSQVGVLPDPIDAADGQPLAGGSPERFTASEVAAVVSGPVLRDRLWLRGAAGATRAFGTDPLTGIATRDRTTQVRLHGVHQPSAHHRFSAQARLSPSSREGEGDRAREDLTATGGAEWLYFASPDVHTRVAIGGLGRWSSFSGLGPMPLPLGELPTVANLDPERTGDDRRRRVEASASVTALDARDPLGVSHDLQAGVRVERAGWDTSWRDLDARDAEPERLVASGSQWAAWVRDTLRHGRTGADLGVRVEGTSVRHDDEAVMSGVLVAPRLGLSYAPSRRAILRLTAGRLGDTLRLGLVGPERPVADEVAVTAGHELGHTAVLSTTASYRHTSLVTPVDTPIDWVGPGLRDPQDTGARYVAWEVALDRELSQRWMATLRYRLAEAVGERLEDGATVTGPLATDVRHRAFASASWAVPLDPWTPTLGAVLEAESGAAMPMDGSAMLGAILDPTRLSGWWAFHLRLAQQIPLRWGDLELSAEWRNVTNNQAAVAPAPWREGGLQRQVPGSLWAELAWRF